MNDKDWRTGDRMNDKGNQVKALLTLDDICILSYLILGFGMLYYADSVEKIMISGIILLIDAIMFHIVYVKRKHLTFKE